MRSLSDEIPAFLDGAITTGIISRAFSSVALPIPAYDYNQRILPNPSHHWFHHVESDLARLVSHL